jgi:hypothetical protein
MYWDTIEDKDSNALVIFAQMLFALVPHAADCKRLFSILEHNNQKSRNHLSPHMLKVIRQLKLNLHSKKNKFIRFLEPEVDNEVDPAIPVIEGNIREEMEHQLEELGFGAVDDAKEITNELKNFYDEENSDPAGIMAEELLAKEDFDLNNQLLGEGLRDEDFEVVDEPAILRKGSMDYNPADLAESLNID